MAYKARDPAERFMSFVSPEPNTGCWLWTGSVNTRRRGYGAFSVGHQRAIGAHRAAWILFRGPITAGLVVCHHCDNPPCVNPDHLFLGTHRDNMTDCARKGRTARTPGSMHPQASFDAAKIDNVFRMLAAGASQAEVARHYGLDRSTVSKMVNGKTYPREFLASGLGLVLGEKP